MSNFRRSPPARKAPCVLHPAPPPLPPPWPILWPALGAHVYVRMRPIDPVPLLLVWQGRLPRTGPANTYHRKFRQGGIKYDLTISLIENFTRLTAFLMCGTPAPFLNALWWDYSEMNLLPRFDTRNLQATSVMFTCMSKFRVTS